MEARLLDVKDRLLDGVDYRPVSSNNLRQEVCDTLRSPPPTARDDAADAAAPWLVPFAELHPASLIAAEAA